MEMDWQGRVDQSGGHHMEGWGSNVSSEVMVTLAKMVAGQML